VKRERILQVVLVIVGLIFSSLGFFLFQMLRHDKWMTGHNDVMPMFLSLYVALGVFLLLAVKHPAKHRSVIAYAAWSSLAHAATMTIMSAQAAAHGTHRQDSPQRHRAVRGDWGDAAGFAAGKRASGGGE
jgi:hypothetical protein